MRILLHLCWTKDGSEDRFVRRGEVVADMGEWGKAPDGRVMQDATHAAKIVFQQMMGAMLVTPVKGMEIHRWYSGGKGSCQTCGRKRRPPQGVCRWPLRRRSS